MKRKNCFVLESVVSRSKVQLFITKIWKTVRNF